MATAVHVNGPALIKVGLQGAGGGALSTVGITENGPLIDIEYFKEPVMADTGGPNLPVDYQKMGKKAKITFALPIYDLSVLTAWIISNQRGTLAADEGKLPALGELIFANNGGFRLVISSPTEAQPWRFKYVSTDYCRLRPGTKYNVYDVGLDAIAYIGTATTALDAELYDHTDG